MKCKKNKEFDKYDGEHEQATLIGKCIFCRIVTKNAENLEYEVINLAIASINHILK